MKFSIKTCTKKSASVFAIRLVINNGYTFLGYEVQTFKASAGHCQEQVFDFFKLITKYVLHKMFVFIRHPMGAEQSQSVWVQCETLMEAEPEAPVLVHEDRDSVVLYDPSSMFDAPRKKRKLWKAVREFNKGCKRRLLRVTRGATRLQFEQRKNDQLAALPYQKYNEAREVLLSTSCTTCCYVAGVASHLKLHELVHSGDKPHHCEQCGRSFSQKPALRSHQRTHTGEKPFKCTHCGRSFAQSKTLDNHRRLHTGEKSYKCSRCDKTFATSGDMRSHERVHTREKPFKCEHCDKTFAQSSTLISHQRTHSGEKPYACKSCGSTFSTCSNLHEHGRIHSGVRPYSCQDCGQTFVKSSNLRSHERTHERPTAFPCEFQDFLPDKFTGEGIQCGLNFKSATSLGFHIRERHDKEHVFKMPAELAVREALMKTFDEVTQHDWQNRLALGSCEPVGNCSYRFDFRTPAPEDLEMLVITEVDEFQHRRYPCDLKRMLHATQVLMQEFPDTPIVFVRWNPDPRKIGAVHYNVPFEARVETLMSVLQNKPVLEGAKKMSDLVHQGLNVIYLYYDLERVDGEVGERVSMLNGVTDDNADNASTVRNSVIATL